MSKLFGNLRYSLRMLQKNPGLTEPSSRRLCFQHRRHHGDLHRRLRHVARATALSGGR